MLPGLIALMIFVSFGAACICRDEWPYLSPRKKQILIIASSSLIASYAFMLSTAWIFTSPLANEILGSATVGGYSLIALLATLFRPKPLTYCLSVLLLLPVPVALVWLPLAGSKQRVIETTHVAGTLYVDKVYWNDGAFGSSGTTLLIYDKPRFVPFIEHHLQTVIFDDSKCAANAAFIVLQPDRRHVLARCPWPEYQHKQGFHDYLVPLY